MRVSLSPQEFRELLLSHHPNLPAFKDDIIMIFGRRVCAGCLLGYPAALITLILVRPSGFDSIILSLLFALISQFRRFFPSATVRHFGRILAGIALGFGLGGAWWALFNGEWLGLLLLVAGAGIYFIMRAYSIKRELEKEYVKTVEKN